MKITKITISGLYNCVRLHVSEKLISDLYHDLWIWPWPSVMTLPSHVHSVVNKLTWNPLRICSVPVLEIFFTLNFELVIWKCSLIIRKTSKVKTETVFTSTRQTFPICLTDVRKFQSFQTLIYIMRFHTVRKQRRKASLPAPIYNTPFIKVDDNNERKNSLPALSFPFRVNTLIPM